MANIKKKKWTVFFLIKSVGVAMLEVIQMLNEIRSLELPDEVAIVICINFHKHHLPALLKGDENLPESDKPEFTTMFFNLQPGKVDARFNTKLHLIEEHEDFDITDPDCLAVFFEKVVKLYPATRNALITWDHGRVYGIFESIENKNAPFDLRNVKLQHEKVKVLTMKELDIALRSAFGKRKIDVMIMMNCYMQFIDTGYALRRSVDYLVAAEGAFFLDGYNYPFIFQALFSNPDIKPEEFGKLTVTSVPSKVYPDGHEIGKKKKAQPAIFLTDLRRYSIFVKMLDRLVEVLLTRIPELKLILNHAKDENAVSNSVFDLFGFISFLESKDLFKKKSLAASLVLSLREMIILESYVGTGQPLRNNNDVITRPSGLTIFIPAVGENQSGPGSGFDNFFYLKTKWHVLIEKLISNN
jgi:hypothetical protein